MYRNYKCKNCNRVRVEETKYGDVCEKCDWNQATNEYNYTWSKVLEEGRDEFLNSFKQ